MFRFRDCRDEEFYLSALSYAQSLLCEGKPAQALLQINKSFLAVLSEEGILEEWPPAYEAVVWIVREYSRSDDEFLGNPVRHYQHLASRMSGTQIQLRTARAWACFHLVEALGLELSRDERQIEEESLVIPCFDDVAARVRELGWRGEGDVLRGTFAGLGSQSC